MTQKPNQRGATRESIKATKHHLPTQTSFQPGKYFRQHQATLTESFVRLINYPLASMMTVMVIAIALSLPGGLYVLLKNVQSVTDQWEQQSVITLYLFPNLEDTQALALSHKLSAQADVASVEYISKEEGLRYFERSSGYEQIMSSLPENPLPIVLRVIPQEIVDITTLSSLQALRDQLASQKEVEYAELDAQWLQRLANILSFGQRFVYALSVLLVIAVLLIVGNTIRMAVESRRDEVLVMKLVGATDAYIRRPFLYMGLWFGVLGGVFAALCILLLSWWVSAPAERLIDLYQSGFELQTFNADEVVLCLTISAFVGVFGAWIAVNRHITNIELQ
ncbi:permease-like cell division protein FtsX [Marinomonas sp. IMCC 4694]|uniref:permease-like cell division protein FtsX n=1 Tax=Marinomonas sp. IMCC 4694 TaxID=2605432 RepID=UPI0011E72F8A|nr:permease-like cell division protein FtsX [Marinomonas sp. IMCC 4694]TYL49195.1 cell division protein FtsX [Marinomonas sp. IMCC 4694]